MRHVLTSLLLISVSTTALAGEPAALGPRRANSDVLPLFAKAMTALEANHGNLVFDDWHPAELDLEELRERLDLREWDATFDRDGLLDGLEGIYAKIAGNSEMRAVLSQLEVREALKHDLLRMIEPLPEDDATRARVAKIVEHLNHSLLVQANDDVHRIRLMRDGDEQRLLVEDRRTGTDILHERVRFERVVVDRKPSPKLPKSVEELAPSLRRKVRRMLKRETVAPHLHYRS